MHRLISTPSHLHLHRLDFTLHASGVTRHGDALYIHLINLVTDGQMKVQGEAGSGRPVLFMCVCVYALMKVVVAYVS